MPKKNKRTRRAADFGEAQRDGSRAETEREGGQSLNVNDNRTVEIMPAECGKRYSNRAIENGKQVSCAAVSWQQDNPFAWAFIVRGAVRLASMGQRVGVQRLIEEVRAHDFADRYGKATKTNNSFVPVFSRQLVRRYPYLSDYIERRASVFDVIGVPECPPVGFDWDSINHEGGTNAD